MMHESHLTQCRRLSENQFYEKARECLERTENFGTPFTLIALDFDNFNYVNDLYGYDVGDHVLEAIISHFDSTLQGDDFFCRQHADHFLICLQTGDSALASRLYLRLTSLKQALDAYLPHHYTLASSGGILVVQSAALSLPALVDQANCARKLAKGTATNTFHIYDSQMDGDAQWKKQVTCMMEAALDRREFELYLQPKALLKTGACVGAEALVRWNHPTYGIIYPDRFIPILEQNGFIRRLDFFMLQEVCNFLRGSAEKGIPLLPISVNFSKSHLQTEKLVDHIFETVNQSGISPHLIEIEFTESILSDDTQRLINTVSDLKLLGFRVSLDDFGSAYSSLNYLKDLPIDVVKIDKGFLDSSTDSDRGKIVIAKVVELIKSLRMLCVMEGVETKEQIEFLKKLSCDIGQGYFFAKPMPANSYANYLNHTPIAADFQQYSNGDDKATPSYESVVPQEFQMDNWELYTLGKNIDMGLMKGYLDDSTVQYVNDRALEYIGYNRQEVRELFHNSIIAFTVPEDVHIIHENAAYMISTGKPVEFKTRATCKDGKVIVLQGRSSCIIDNHGRPMGLYAFRDVTEELEQTAALQQALEEKIEELQKTISAE